MTNAGAAVANQSTRRTIGPGATIYSVASDKMKAVHLQIR